MSFIAAAGPVESTHSDMDRIKAFLFGAMFLGCMASGAQSAAASGLGRVMLFGAMGGLALLGFAQWVGDPELRFRKWEAGIPAAFITLGFYASLRAPSFEAMKGALTFVGIGVFCACLRGLRTSHALSVSLGKIGGAAILLSLLLCLFGPRGDGETGWYKNGNYAGALFFLFSYFPFCMLKGDAREPKIAKWAISLAVIGILATRTRSALLALMVAGFVAAIREPILSRRTKSILLTLGLLFAVLGAYLVTHKDDPQVALISLALSGKRLDTGRGELWAILIGFIKMRPWFGWGTGMQPEDFCGSDLSSHNGYIQLGLQLGLVGVMLAMSACFSALWTLARSPNPNAKYAFYFLLGAMIHEYFEVMLFQNSAPFFLPMWGIVGLSLAKFRESPPPATT